MTRVAMCGLHRISWTLKTMEVSMSDLIPHRHNETVVCKMSAIFFWLQMHCSVLRKKAITWSNVDSNLWCHMASLGHNDLLSNLLHKVHRGDKIVDHSDVVGASPVGAAPTTSSFST